MDFFVAFVSHIFVFFFYFGTIHISFYHDTVRGTQIILYVFKVELSVFGEGGLICLNVDVFLDL